MAWNSEAIEQIQRQKARYCRYLDTKQFDAWENIFKPDASITFYNLDHTVMAEFHSAAELAAASRELFSTTRTIHQTHNAEIELRSPTEATAIWSMEDWHVHAPEADKPPKTLHGYGFYHETWERIGEEWKLARMELRRNILMHT